MGDVTRQWNRILRPLPTRIYLCWTVNTSRRVSSLHCRLSTTHVGSTLPAIHHRQLLLFHLTENVADAMWWHRSKYHYLLFGTFHFFDMSFGVYEPVGKVAGYEPGNGSLMTYRPNNCCFLFTLELTQDPVQYSLEVREPPCLGLKTSVITSFYTAVSTFRGRFQRINCVVLCLIVLFHA
jgi:hypothetical protein